MVEFEFNPNWGRIGWVTLGAVLGIVVLWVFYSFVGTFVFALFIYYSTRRVNGHIRDRVGQRSVSAALALIALALPAVLLLLYATAIGAQELQEFAGTTDLDRYIEIAGPYVNVTEAVENPRDVFEGAGGMDLIQTALNRGTSYLGLLATGLLHLFIMFAVAFYLLRDDHKLADWVANFDGDGPTVFEEFAREVDDSLELIFAGNILNAIVTATVGAITYSILNIFAPPEVAIPYAALVGLLTGIASLIPVVGMKLVYVPMTGYLAATAFSEGSGWGFVVAFAAISFVIVDVIPDLLVRPYVTGGTLHTGSVMFAYILGSLLFGWYGLFLGPMVLVFVTHFAKVVVPELFGMNDDDGAQPAPSTADRSAAETPPDGVDEETAASAAAAEGDPVADRPSDGDRDSVPDSDRSADSAPDGTTHDRDGGGTGESDDGEPTGGSRTD
ncbi:AI-2E family transporter [Halosimplex amylolyticum]|uniref:AI-2E family transporter n=1 Tax=Halosimplex amylolyticum TaxID=3396616 RepID=UPI003F55527C